MAEPDGPEGQTRGWLEENLWRNLTESIDYDYGLGEFIYELL